MSGNTYSVIVNDLGHVASTDNLTFAEALALFAEQSKRYAGVWHVSVSIQNDDVADIDGDGAWNTGLTEDEWDAVQEVA